MVFEAVNASGATPEAMQFQYMQMLPKLASNAANKLIIVPADMAGMAGLTTATAQITQGDHAEAGTHEVSEITEGADHTVGSQRLTAADTR